MSTTRVDPPPFRAVTVVKSSAVPNSTSTLANDTALQFPIAALESWEFELQVSLVLDPTGSLKFAIATPAGSSGILFYAFGAGNVVTALNTTLTLTPGAGGATVQLFLKGSCVAGATAGAVAFQFAEFGGGSVTVNAGSTLKARKGVATA